MNTFTTALTTLLTRNNEKALVRTFREHAESALNVRTQLHHQFHVTPELIEKKGIERLLQGRGAKERALAATVQSSLEAVLRREGVAYTRARAAVAIELEEDNVYNPKDKAELVACEIYVENENGVVVWFKINELIKEYDVALAA